MTVPARVLAIALAFVATAALAQGASSPAPPPSAADAERAAALAAAPASAPGSLAVDSPLDDATLTVLNRPVVVFRAPLLGVSPRERMQGARERIRALAHSGGAGKVTLQDYPVGVAVMIDDQIAFVVTNEDANAVPGATARSIASDAAATLTRIAEETREARDATFLLRAGLHAAVATLVWLALMWLARAVWRTTGRWLEALVGRHAARLRVGSGELILRERAAELARWAAAALAILTMLLLTFEWLGYVLGRFPYTRPWSEGLFGFLIGTAIDMLEAVARVTPSLFVAIVIFVIAWVVDRAQRRFFDRVAAGRLAVGSIDRDTAPPTRRLTSIAIWLFAAVMAYPYIPGSDSEAFKGLSVLLGIMVSVGASGIVGQAASGLILMYTRTFRTGEYVRIGDREGTMTRIGMFTSTVRTGIGEELTMPNSLVLASVTTNYSRVVPGPGFMLAAKVSIGYDAPWRQVHALLIEAARATAGVLDEPPPRVFQTSLDDYYVQYRLVCQASPTDPLERAKVLSALHAAIQDAFNAHGVQIMSPHYMMDPDAPKVVPRARWYAPPARSDDGETPR